MSLEKLAEAELNSKKPPAADLRVASEGVSFADTQKRIVELANLSPVEYDKVRKDACKELGIRPVTLDKAVKRTRDEPTDGLDDVEPWGEPVVLAELLDEISFTVQRFIVCNAETAHAAALWIVMTWVLDSVFVSPLAVITAPEKRCGKSQLLFVLGKLVKRPLAASNISAAALFRAIDAWKPTLLVDEADAFMRDNEDLRGILNCGHTRDSAYVIRTVGDTHEPKRFNVWGAKAIAGIGHLADTLMDRSIVLELRRKLPHESVERLRHAEPELFDVLAAKLARFAQDNLETVRKCKPELPAVLHDRAQDNWEPLLAIAGVAGGNWVKYANEAAIALTHSGEGGSVGNELLADIKEIIDAKKLIKIPTSDLIGFLCDDDEKPWSTYNRGKRISPRQIAKYLKGYEIISHTIRIGGATMKGYETEQFDEAFLRYLTPDLSVTASQFNSGEHFSVAHENALSLHPSQGNTQSHSESVSDDQSRYRYENLFVTGKPNAGGGCDVVTDRTIGANEEKFNGVEL